MLQHQSVNIRQISQNRAEQVGYYRFLGNENVTVSELARSVADQCQQQVEGLHVLSISDTSEINLQAHRGRLKLENRLNGQLRALTQKVFACKPDALEAVMAFQDSLELHQLTHVLANPVRAKRAPGRPAKGAEGSIPLL